MFSGKTRRQWKVAKCSSIIGMEVWQVSVSYVLKAKLVQAIGGFLTFPLSS